MGDKILIMSSFDNYLNSLFLNDKNPALRESLGRGFQEEKRAS